MGADKFEMVVQAFEYEKEHLLPREMAVNGKSCAGDAQDTTKTPPPQVKKTKCEEDKKAHRDIRKNVFSEPLRGFFVSTNSVMKTPLFRRLDAEVRERREKMLLEKGWTVNDDERQKP